ncbi:acyl-CoA dehydrogenase [Streptomyces sp. cg35]|uniref:acyl-CoA dehydrogenase family protein n=1 Tax=Streptomyces sp. cg35 TaxID=3421650 RepID=UPI003D175D7D
MAETDQTSTAVEDLTRLFHGERSDTIHRQLTGALSDPLFEPRDGLTSNERAELAYARLRLLSGRLPSAVAITKNPRSLFALLDATAVVDTTLAAVAAIHYNLCLGTLLDYVGGQPSLQPYIDELDTLGSIGVFMATELGYGNNVKALETEAVFDPATNTFTLHTRTPQAQKYMPNTAVALPKIAIVMARLKVGDRDHGVFPFVARIRDAEGPCTGVRIVPLPEKPGLDLDNAITIFEGLRLPREAIMLGSHSHLEQDGTFRSSVGAHQRFLEAMKRVIPGKLGLTGAHLACARASVAITARYSKQRLTFAPGKAPVPIIEYQNHQRAVIGALARTYGMSFLVSRARRELDSSSGGADLALERLIAVTKVSASQAAEHVVLTCRERCGAQGMFGRNRIADYIALGHLVITSEGDNDVIALKAAQQMVLGSQYAPPLAGPRPESRLAEPEFWIWCLRTHEARLYQQLTQHATTEFEKDTGSFSLWNAVATDLLALARVHGLRMAAEELQCVLQEAAPRTRRMLQSVGAVFALQEISGDTGWYLTENILSAEEVRGIPPLIDDLCGELMASLDSLVDGYNLPPHHLRAPIADDYLHAYDYLHSSLHGASTAASGASGSRESSSQPEPQGQDDHPPQKSTARASTPALPRGSFYVDVHAPKDRWGRELDPLRDANLLDHCVKGKPTLPGSHMLEIAAEAAMGIAPDLVPIRFSKVRFHAFLRMNPDRPVRFRATVREVTGQPDDRQVTVHVLSDVVHPSGRVLRRDRLHAEATVHLAAEATRPAPPPCPLDLSSRGTLVADPYFLPAVPMTLRGAYDSTRGCWLGPTGSATELDLRHAARDSAFTRFTIPCLTIDALTRVPYPDPDDTSRIGVAVPLGYEQLDLYTSLNDIDLFQSCGNKLTLIREPADNPHPAFYLVSADGDVLIRMADPNLQAVAWVPASALRGEPVTPDQVVTSAADSRESASSGRNFAGGSHQ